MEKHAIDFSKQSVNEDVSHFLLILGSLFALKRLVMTSRPWESRVQKEII